MIYKLRVSPKKQAEIDKYNKVILFNLNDKLENLKFRVQKIKNPNMRIYRMN